MTGSSERFELKDLYFVVIDLDSGDVKRFNPDDNTWMYTELREGAAEKAVTTLYEKELGYTVRNIKHKLDPSLQKTLGLIDNYAYPTEAPSELVDSIESTLSTNSSSSQEEMDLTALEGTGIPDLIVYSNTDSSDFEFVEVKFPPEPVRDDQKKWLNEFDFFDRKLACVFEDEVSRDRYIRNHSVEELLREDLNKIERQSMTREEIASMLEKVEVGDLIRFDGQKSEFEVVEKDVTWKVWGGDVTGVKAEPVQGKAKVFSKEGDWYTGGNRRHAIEWLVKA